MRVSWRLRAAVLVLAGSMLLHHARFALSPADVGDRHGYLAWLAPMLAGLVLLVGVEFAVRVARALRGRVLLAAPPRRRTLWPELSALLLAIFGAQEVAEFLAAQGHSDHEGLSHLFGQGAWLAVPLSLLIGGLISLLVRAADAVIAWAAAGHQRRRPRAPLVLARRPALEPARRSLNVLASFLAGRAPPALST